MQPNSGSRPTRLALPLLAAHGYSWPVPSHALPGASSACSFQHRSPPRGDEQMAPEPRPTERGGPETVTSFTVPVISPSFFFITSLVRTVSDSMVFYGRNVVSFRYNATVLL